MRTLRSFVLAAAAVAVLFAAPSHAAAPKALGQGSFKTADMDTTCAPCKDFYRYVNGTWSDQATIPPSYTSLGTGVSVRDRNQEHVHQLLEDAVKNVTQAPKGSNAWKLGVFYGSCMDSTKAEELGSKPIEPEMARIAAIQSKDQLVAEVAHLHGYFINAMFRGTSFADLKNSSQIIATLFQGGLGLPERDYYFKQDSASTVTRDAYLAHMARTFEMLGDAGNKAKAEAATVMALETALAKVSTPRVELRDPTKRYHIYTMAGLDTLSPGFDWAAYFRASNFPAFERLNVTTPDFFRGMGALMASTPLEDWKTYLRWKVADASAPGLSSAWVNEDFHFSQILNGTKEQLPRWKRCLNSTDAALGEALGEEFARRYFTPATKARALELVKNLEAVMHDRIGRLEWMGDSTKVAARGKLATVQNKIGYPDKWRDYSAMKLTPGDWFANRAAGSSFEARRQIAKIGQPVDRGEWNMTPPTVNAYYNPTWNEIVFPAGILQPPYFDPTADDALNYGSIGSVIGHEMTHGFDDSGSRFDAQGNLRDWWTTKDNEQFRSRTGRVVDQFNGYVALDTLHVNGRLTLGENIADLGGLSVAYEAFERSLKGKPRTKIDGFTPEQRFFLGYAREWRWKVRDAALRTRVLTDPHAPNNWRTDGPLSNMPEFAKAFGCKAGDPMVRPDSLQAKIW